MYRIVLSLLALTSLCAQREQQADSGRGGSRPVPVKSERVIRPRAAGADVGLMADAQNPLIALSFVATPTRAVSVAVNGNFAYVCSQNEITVVNILNPASPVVVNTFTTTLINNAGSIQCSVQRGVLSIFSDSVSTTQGNNPGYVAFSLASPIAPVLITQVPVNKRFFSRPLYLGNYAFVPMAAQIFFPLFGYSWEDQLGDLLSFDLTNFATPTLIGSLRQVQTDAVYGGAGPVLGITQASTALAYIGGTTSTGGANNGAGRLQVVDLTNPAGMTVVGELRFPGTLHMGAPLVQGTLGLAVGNTDGYTGVYQSDPGTKGKLVFVTLDLSNRRSPEIITTKISDYKPGSGGGFAKIGANLFAVAGVRNAADQELMLVVDTSNPRNVAFKEFPLTNPVTSLEAIGKVLYATTNAGLRIYDIPDADAVVLSSCASSVDVAFAVDRASGVAGQAFAEAVAGAKRMMGQLNLPATGGSDRVSVVSFTTAATLEQVLTGDKAAAGAALDRIIAGGNTYIGAGIEAAQAELLGARRNPLAQPVIVLLSDGRDAGAPNTAASAAAAAAAKAAGIKIITVAYGQTTAAGNARLAGLASSAGEQYSGVASGQAGPVTVLDANTCQASITILSSAAAGPRTVETTTGTYVSSLPNAFTVQGSVAAPAANAITIVGLPSPPSGGGGTEVTLNVAGLPGGTITPASVRISMRLGGGTSTNASAAATIFTVNAGGAGTLKFRVPSTIRVTQATAFQLLVAGQTDAGVAFSSTNTAVFTLTPGAALAGVKPTASDPGKTLLVTLVGVSTHWVDGQTMVSFGPGISVGSGPVGGFGRVDVQSPARAVAELQIVGAAASGLRKVELQTGSEYTAQTGLFRVNPAQTPRVLTLTPSTSPDRGYAGTVVELTATGFPAGAIAPSAVRIRLNPTGGEAFAYAEVRPSVIVGTTGTGRILRFALPAVYSDTPVAYGVTVSGTNLQGIPFVSGNTAGLTQLTAIRPDFVSPTSIMADQTVTVTVRVPLATFQQGVTDANFGPELGVGGAPFGAFGPVTVSNSTTVSLTLRSSVIANGTRTVQIRTGSQVVAFSFDAFGPIVYAVEPSRVFAGQPTQITIFGSRTHFSALTTVQCGPGWSVGGAPAGAPGPVAEVVGQTTVKVFVTAASDAEPYVLPTVRTGDEVIISQRDLFVTIPQIQVSPDTGGQGQTQTVSIRSYDGFAQLVAGQSVANFGPGISVGGAAPGADGPITVSNPYQAQATIVIQPNAPPGLRPVTVKTGPIAVSTQAGSGYRVYGPLLTDADPYAYTPGQSYSVVLYFRYVDLRGQTVTANFGPGIKVGGGVAGAFGPVTVLEATTARAQIEVQPDAPRSQRQVGVTVGGANADSDAYVGVVSSISSISPVSGVAGQTVNVRLTGLFTQWTPGNLIMYADLGMRIGGAAENAGGAVAVASATDATASVEILPWLPDGTYSFYLFDQATSEDWSLYNVFTVTNPLPHILDWSPGYAPPGQTLTMTVTGRNTAWAQGQTRVGLGPDIQINGGPPGVASLVTVVSPTQLTFTITVGANVPASYDQRDLTVTTGTSTQIRPRAVYVGFGPE